MVKLICKLFTVVMLGGIVNPVLGDDHASVPATNIWTAQNIEFKDGQMAAFRQGLAELMASDIGKEFPGTVYFNWILSDGNARATHSLINSFPSTKAWSDWNTKFFTMAASGSNAASKWMRLYGNSIESTSTSTLKVAQSWGNTNEMQGPTVWVPFYTEDLASFISDFSDYMKTPTGKGFKGAVAIHQCIACGEQTANAGFTVNHESPASFDEWYSDGQYSKDFSEWVSKANEKADFTGNWMIARLDSYLPE